MLRISVAFLFAVFASAVNAEVIINSDGNIEYSGSITEENNSKVFTLYSNAELKPKRLIISSLGGHVDYGMQLGEWLLANQLAVEIGDYCMSSCANYVFLAGTEKILGKYSFIGFHGGLLQRAVLPFKDQQYLKAVTKLTATCDLVLFDRTYKAQLAFPFSGSRLRECALMQATGVDYKILLAGQYEKYRVDILQLDVWSYDLEALAALGVKSIRLKDGEWLPPKALGEQSIFYFNAAEITFLNGQVGVNFEDM